MVQLSELIGNASLTKLLEFFLNNPSQEFSQVKIKNKTKLAKATLIKWLKKLEKGEIVKTRKEGVSKLYKLNKTNTIVKQLKILNTLLKLQPIKRFLAQTQIKLFLYGSAARGEDEEQSDIDLLILGNLKKEEIITGIEKFSEKINKKINTTIFNPIEWSIMIKKDKAFYERVEKDKIEL